MSITTSREEREQAASKLAEKTDEQLRGELEYWAVAEADHRTDWNDLTERRQRVGDLFLEAQAWRELVTEQLLARHRKATS